MEYRYLLLADDLENKIRTGKYRAGEKLPSLRAMHYQTGRSMSTVVQAYAELEQRGVIDVRERSGYYVRPLIEKILKPPVRDSGVIAPLKVTINAMASILDETARNPALLPFGSALPDPAILPGKELARQIREIAADYADGRLTGYCQPAGLPALCREIEKRMIGWLPAGGSEQVIISGGCMAAISLCLRTVARAGDVILVESPTFLCYLQLIEDLDMRALEIPVDPVHGVDISLLRQALEEQPVAAALVNPNFHNPLGCVMSDEDKGRLVTLFQEKEIPVIEDDIYGDLYFGETRPRPLKSFDTRGMVLYCSSFSKTLAPDLRIGWMVAGRYSEKVKRLSFNSNLAHSQLLQQVIASFLASGAYERHLRRMRLSLKKQLAPFLAAIALYFPQETRVSIPRGGMCLWVELVRGFDSWNLFERLKKHDISIVPGSLCSVTGRYDHCLRLNFGYQWTERSEQGIRLLGGEIERMLAEMPSTGAH